MESIINTTAASVARVLVCVGGVLGGNGETGVGVSVSFVMAAPPDSRLSLWGLSFCWC